MDPSLRLLFAIASVVRVIAVVGFYIVGQWTIFRALLDGLPFHQAMAWGFLSAAGFTALTYYVLKFTDRWIDRRPEVQDANRVAALLEAMLFRGLQSLSNQQIVNIWYAEQAPNDVLMFATKAVMYGVLREGTVRGWIRAELPADSSQTYQCSLADAISFFRERRWLQLRREMARVATVAVV